MVAAPDMTSYWREVLEGFEPNELDIPMAAIYSLEQSLENGSTTYMVHFQGGLGLPEAHRLAVKHADLYNGTELVVSLFRKAMGVSRPLVLHIKDGQIPRDLLHGIQWRGFGPSTTFVILRLTAADDILGFLLMGLNSRRCYDDDYQDFMQLLSRQLSTSLTSALLIKKAKQKQLELSNDLAASESRFRALTELNTTGYVELFSIFCRNSCVSQIVLYRC